MVTVTCPTGQKTFLQYQLGSQIVRHNEVTEYFLYSPNQIPITEFLDQLVWQGNTYTATVLSIYSSGKVKIPPPPGSPYTQNRFLINGWGIDADATSDSAHPGYKIQYYSKFASVEGGRITSLEQILTTNNPNWTVGNYVFPNNSRTVTHVRDYILPATNFSWFMYQHDRQYSGGVVNDHIQYPVRPPIGLWRLVVKKGSEVVDSVSFSNQPIITTGCASQQCPPNTCSVDCGSYVCCYGADGISVFNYNK
jgi:hypothetical protein